MEQFVAQLVDGSSVHEGFVLHDVEQTVAHFHLNAHFEPLVVNIESRAKFSGAVEAFCDEVVDKLNTVDNVFIVFLFNPDTTWYIGSTSVFNIGYNFISDAVNELLDLLYLPIKVINPPFKYS